MSDYPFCFVRDCRLFGGVFGGSPGFLGSLPGLVGFEGGEGRCGGGGFFGGSPGPLLLIISGNSVTLSIIIFPLFEVLMIFRPLNFSHDCNSLKMLSIIGLSFNRQNPPNHDFFPPRSPGGMDRLQQIFLPESETGQ